MQLCEIRRWMRAAPAPAADAVHAAAAAARREWQSERVAEAPIQAAELAAMELQIIRFGGLPWIEWHRRRLISDA